MKMGYANKPRVELHLKPNRKVKKNSHLNITIMLNVICQIFMKIEHNNQLNSRNTIIYALHKIIKNLWRIILNLQFVMYRPTPRLNHEKILGSIVMFINFKYSFGG